MTPSIPLYLSSDLRRVEAAAADQPLMQRAGRAAADLASRICTGRGASILVLAGHGNNGGDAFEAARLLRERFFETQVVFCGDVKDIPMDASDALQNFTAAGGRLLPAIPDIPRWSLIIDGLFGIGLKREVMDPYAGLIRQANHLARRDHCPLLALDCPSGLEADTGKRHGVTIRASHTITFIGAKPGLFTADGPDHCGTISVAPLDLGPDHLSKPSGHTIGLDQFNVLFKPRPLNSHKGNYGDAGILGGARSMVGAAFLAGRAALRLGSGRVYVGLLVENTPPAFDPSQPELMLRTPEKLIASGLTALACGPGMGKSPEAHEWLRKACRLDIPLVLDADALNLVAEDNELLTLLGSRHSSASHNSPTLLTPHPAEAARLLNSDTATIQADRITAALELAGRFKAHVALKGCGTLVATPEGQWFVNTTGNPGLATAGSGDVLTGLITALLAQNWPPREALLAAVHLHGLAADRLVEQGLGPIGLTAGELIDSARHSFNEWISSQHAT